MSTIQNTFERLLTDREVAAMVGVSVATVRRWRLRHLGPQYLRIGVLIRYRPGSVRQWLDGQPAGGTTDLESEAVR
jgi:predicted DNA-binding transcriptional regulator AlpA